MMNKIRNTLFWIVDYMTGGKIRSAYRDLETYYTSDSTSNFLIEHQKSATETLIQHATRNTLFYNKYLGKKNLSEYPVINKEIIRSNQDDFISNQYDKDKLIKMSTSGSTGTPFTCYQNREKKRRVNAETIFYNGKAGYQVGNKIINLRSLNIKSQKSRVKQWIQNEKLIDIDKLDKNEIEKLCSEIVENSKSEASTMLSYASTYDALSDYFKKYNFNILENSRVNGIISTSELLYDQTRQSISQAFNCNCYSRYANMENGMLGQDIPSHPNTFIINEANYYIEILKMDSDQNAEYGEVGRVVVTDFYNYAMPMIRYDTGDVGTFTYIEVNGNEKKAITKFGGRKIDMIYDINETYVSPHKISVSFWGFDELKQFQFIQEGKKTYRVLLIAQNEFTRECELNEKLRDILGKKANIIIEFVEEIPILDSGKTKYIINKTL